MNDIIRNFFSRALWLRILYMIVFYFVSKLVFMLIILITVIQSLSKLITGNVLEPVWKFSQSLNIYILQIMNFLTFHTEEKPFPFSNWPSVVAKKKEEIIIDCEDEEPQK